GGSDARRDDVSRKGRSLVRDWVCRKRIENLAGCVALRIRPQQVREIARALCASWHGRDKGLGLANSCALIVDEEKCPILNDRATKRASKLILFERRNGGERVVEEILRVHIGIAEKFERAAVEIVRARLDDYVDNRTALPDIGSEV